MKTIEEVLNNYKEYQTTLDDRFGKRLCDFLTNEQAQTIGFEFVDGYVNQPKEWTHENIVAQLKDDLEFGWEKCCDERGVSAELMSEVVRSWCKVLENGLEDIEYGWYGDNVFKTVASSYCIELD